MPPGPAARPTVLVVDDETGILETLRILLKNEGFYISVPDIADPRKRDEGPEPIVPESLMEEVEPGRVIR